MATQSIDTIKKYTEYLVRKNNSAYLTPEQFNLIFNRAQLSYFTELYGNPHEYQPGNPVSQIGFQITQKISDVLHIFLADANLIPNSQGVANYPSDWVDTNSYRYKTQLNGNTIYVPIEIVDQDKEDYRLSSVIVPPTRTEPIVIEKANYLQFYPVGLPSVTMHYLRYPVEVKWAYTTVNSRPVYDPANSVDPEWQDISINDIISIALKSIGISIKDADILGFAKEQTITGA